MEELEGCLCTEQAANNELYNLIKNRESTARFWWKDLQRFDNFIENLNRRIRHEPTVPFVDPDCPIHGKRVLIS